MSDLRTVVAAHIADLRLVSKKIRASEFAGSFHETAREFDKAADELQSALDAQPVAVAAVPDAYQKALDAALSFIGDVAPGASWWDDVWPEHDAALLAAQSASAGEKP